MSQDKSTLIYVGDPMCSWCYGFAPELSQALNELDDVMEVEIVMGGLRPYNQETMLDLKSFLTHHWEDVHKASGQEFSYGILSDETITYDTEPPARAVVVVRELDAAKEMEFFKCTQELFYRDNMNMHLVDSYTALLNKLDINVEEFTKRFHSDEMKQKVKADFARAAELGVRGFPAVLIEKEGKVHVVSNGYTKSEELLKRISSLK